MGPSSVEPLLGPLGGDLTQNGLHDEWVDVEDYLRGESRGRGSRGLVQRGLNQSGTSPALGVKIAFGWGTEQGEPMRKFIAGKRRRTLLKASAAASLLAV